MKSKIVRIGILLSAFYAVSYLMYEFANFNALNYCFFYIIIFTGIYYIFKYQSHCNNALIGNKYVCILAALSSLTVVTGFFFDNDLSFEMMGAQDAFNYLLCVVGLTSLFKCFWGTGCELLEKWIKLGKNSVIKKEDNYRKLFLLSFTMILGCWIIVWLAYYPGLWNYDPWQVDQFIYKQFNKFHPLIHTLLLSICYCTGVKIGNVNIGVIIYDFIQMSIMAGIFSYTYVYLCKNIYSKFLRIIILAFYAIFPVNSILAISTTKDVIFSGMVLFCLVLSIQMKEITSEKKENVFLILLLVTSTIMLLFRNNAIYAFYLFLFSTLISTIRSTNKAFRKILIYSICCLLSFKATDMVLTKALNASKGQLQEAFSVPSQQFGRIYDALRSMGTDQETLDIVNTYYDMSRSTYMPYIADSMKSTLDLENNTLIAYIGDSVKLFCKYPIISLDSFLYLTEGAWNISDISHARIYGEGLETRYGYLPTDNKESYGIELKSKLPGLEALIERAFSNNEYQDWPVISLLFSPALYIWILFICTILVVKTKNRYYTFIVSFLWFLLLTTLAGPCVLIRYYYPFIVCSPVLLCMAKISLCMNKQNDK